MYINVIHKLVGKRSVDVESVKKDEGLSTELLVHHHTEDAHLRGPSIVQFLRSQINHVFLTSRERSESDREFGRTEISRERTLLLLPPTNLEEAGNGKNRQEKLDRRDVEDSLVTSREVLAAGETSARPGRGISPSGEHGNTSVLQLNISEAVETLLRLSRDVAKRIPASELCSKRTEYEL